MKICLNAVKYSDGMRNHMMRIGQGGWCGHTKNSKRKGRIPSSPYLSVADAKLRIEMGSEKMLSGILEPLRDKYEFILIDTGPSLAGTLNVNALVAADRVVIVSDPQFLAMMGVKIFLSV